MGKIDTFSRTIEGCDFMTFRELAIYTIQFIGLNEVKLTDGWRDGGTDIQIGINKGSETNIAVQVSVEKKWQSKIISDIRKIKKNYPTVKATYYISSRRLQERDFEPIRQRVYEEFNISLFKYDNQGISSILNKEGKIEEGLTKINYDVPKLIELRQSYRKFDPHNSAVLSLLFFSNEITEARNIALCADIISMIFESSNKISELNIIEGLSPKYTTDRIKKSIEQLRGKDEIYGKKDEISLKKELYDTILANEVVKTKELYDLYIIIENTLKKYNNNKSITENQINKIIENIGSFYVISSGRISAQLNHQSTNLNSIQQSVKEGIKKLYVLLDETGVDPKQDKENVLNEVCIEAAKTNLMESLAAAEVIKSIENLTSEDLLIALGGSEGLIVLLDSSVSIPIICSYLFESTKESFIYFSKSIYDACNNHSMLMQIPIEYVEEMATHLIYAHKKYNQIIGEDAALAYSENGYVAHYVGLLDKHKNLVFEDFLDHMGLTKRLQTNFPYGDDSSFHLVKDKVTFKLVELLQKANISVMQKTHVPYKVRKNVENEVSHAMRLLKYERPKILMDHDVSVLSSLMEKSTTVDNKYILLTWDRIHFTVRGYLENSNWETFDPPTFLDILHMCKSEDDILFGNSTLSIVKKMSEDSVRNTALIWDTIADMEKENFNIVLIQQAKGFKNDYLQNSENTFSKTEIKDKWRKWKEN